MYKHRDPEGNEIQHLQAFLEVQDAHVLEVGTGEGRLTWRIAQFARRIIGIDPDVERLKQAIAARPADLEPVVFFARAQAEHLPFANRQFDATVLAWSL